MQLLRNHFVYAIIIFFVIATPLSTTDQYTTLAVNWTFPEGTYFEYKIQFRHLEFLNSSRIDTPAETPGFQNGTFRIDAISVQSDDFVLTDISLTIEDLITIRMEYTHKVTLLGLLGFSSLAVELCLQV